MKRLLLAVTFCLIGFQCLAATLPLGPGSIFPLGPSATGTPASGPQFFVDAINGNDSNNGTTPALAWKTITHVNAQTFAANSTISFHGSQTFSGGIVFTAANASSPTVQVYGAGQAVISSGNSAECIKSTDVVGLTVKNIVCTGGGNLTNTTAGISVINDQAGNTKLAGPTISGVTVSGYGYNGISIQGSNGSSGFNGITISNNTVHDVTGNSTDVFGTACIMLLSKTGYGSGISAPSHTNITISGNTVYNCTGTAGNFNDNGNGIFVGESAHVVIGALTCATSCAQANVVHDFGINDTNSTGGAAGLTCYDGTDCHQRYNEVYNGMHGSGGVDGGGLTLNGGQTNSDVEYNWIHDNAGAAMVMGQYNDLTCCTQWGGNTVAFNVTQNNGNELEFDFTSATTGSLNVYRNTFINEGVGFGATIIAAAGSTHNAATAIANNILISNTGNTVSLPAGTTSGLTFTGNDYYGYGFAFAVNWGGTSYSTFAAWQTATGQEKLSGVNVGLTSNPGIYVPGGGFVNSGYVPANLMAYNLQSGAGAIGAGVLPSAVSITLPATDYYGAAVAPTSQTIGAAEGDFAAFASSCAPATNYLARVSSFNKLDNVNYNSLLCVLNADGILPHLDFLHALAAPNSAAAVLNLLSTNYSLVVHLTPPTFAARVGYTGNGTGYFDTQYTPSTAGGAMTLNSGSIGVYATVAGTPNKTEIGSTNNTTTEISIFTQAGGAGTSWFTDVNDFTGRTGNGTGTAGIGLFVGTRPDATHVNGWFNGVVVGAAVPVNAVALTPNSIFLFAENTAGSPTTPSTATLAFDFLGDAVYDQSGMAHIVNSFMQAYGINTY